ncbi:uncharacterized protein LOC118320745 [Morone saxatilis]|uniref:uncharacterized protein LOC118320745 n=1 Tax=Morone saxatilis TaxID=34816 RepID=UPI0015E1FA74|nr:uncharacterized protein LOC118320745 [Morone saxatilis]
MRVCVDSRLGLYIPHGGSFLHSTASRTWWDTTLRALHCALHSGHLLLLSQYNMEVEPSVQEACNHAASLLTSLNLQRERAQFCDCVVRQKQSPGQLYPAHRCVLAASSPMLASILSSSGVLVELHLSDSVLELVLDYIYTGALPYTLSQQQHYNLLTAACYLQMDDLQDALRTEVNTADNTNASTGTENQSYKDINTKTDTCSANSLERENQYCDDIDACRSSSKTDAYHCNNLSNASTSCSLTERSGRSVNAGNCRQATYLMPQDLIQNIPGAAEAHGVSMEEPAATAENRRHLYSRCTAEVQEEETSRAEKTQQLGLTVKSKAGEKQTNRKEEDKMLRSPLPHLSTSRLKDKFSPSQHSSSSPHLCCGAVPVIRHSGRIAMAEVPPYHPVSQASVNSSRAPDLRLGSTDNDRIVEGITTEHKNHYEAQNRDYRNNEYHIGTQSSDQCAIQDLCYKSNADESDIKRQDYNSSNTDSDEYMGNGLSHITDHNDHHAHCDTFRNKTPTKHFSDDSVLQNKDCSSFTKESRNKTDLSFKDFPSKHQRLDCSDCHNVSNDPSVVVPLPVQEEGTGSDCEDLCPEGEVKEEQSYSSRCPTKMDRQDNHCNLYGPRYTSTKDANSSQREHDNKDTAMDHNTDCTFLEHENMSGIGPHLTFTVPVDNNMSDPTYSVVGQSYSGHLRYHCLPQEDTHLSHRDSDHKHSHPSHPDHSDQSTDEEEEEDASPGLSPLSPQHFATTDQVLLLDISAKPAELLVSYKHRSDEGEKWVALSQKDTCGNGYGNNDRLQRNEAVSWVGETNVEERKSVSKEENRPGAEVVHKGENQTITWTACSPPSVPDSVQASVSSSLSVCIPSTLSASMPKNISAHLSTPVHHPFQCSLCERSFSQRGSLNRHVRSHLGVRPFPCPRCPMTFSRQYRVTEHMRVHQRCVLGSDFQKPPASSI